MSNYKRKEVMDYLTRKPVTTQDIELARTRIQPPVAPAPMQVTSGEELGTREGFRDGTTLPINPMLDNVNPNTIGGAAIVPTAGITAAAIADRFNISLEDAGRMLKRLYTGPEGLVIGGDRLTEEAKPDIEKFPSNEKQETTLVTKKPDQIKTETGLTPPTIDTEIPGLQPDRGTDTSILYKGKMPEERLKKVEETYYELKKELKRNPSRAEISNKLNISSATIKPYLEKLNLPDIKVTTKDFNKYENVNVPTITETGIKWPSKEEEFFYINNLTERFKYPKKSSEYIKKIDSGELLSNKKLAEKYNLTEGTIENINTKIIKDYKLNKLGRPVIGLDESQKEAQARKREVRKKYSDYNYEVNKISGTKETQLGHASDVFNIQTKPETLVYTPRDINAMMGKRNQADYVIRGIVEKQEELIKNKPKDWEKSVKELNEKGMDYAVQTKGYKVFEPIDLKTLKRKPFFVDYSKIIDPTDIYKGKTIKEIAEIEKQVNKIKKKESSLTKKEIKMLQDHELYEKNRKAVLEAQSRIEPSEITNVMKELLKVKKPEYAVGGRVKLANGSDDGYFQEIPTLPEADPIRILEDQLIAEKDPTKVMALLAVLDLTKKEQAAKERARQEEKAAQKAKGVRYKEDFPSEAAYFAETGKQLLTNPKYFLSKGAKGAVEGTEFLVGQPLQTLFSQTGKNFEFYEPVLGEKLGINKYIEKNIPKNPTTGTLLAGDVAEIAGSVADPFLLYGIGKAALKSTKPKPPTTAADETIDPTRRDILKTGVVMGAGAALYPTAKKLGMFDNIAKTAAKKAPLVRIVKPLGVTETKFPEWFPSLVNRLRKEGTQKPIYVTKEVPLTKEEYLKLKEKGTEKIYDRYQTRTQDYIDELKQKGIPQYYQVKNTDEIIGYEYIDKNLPDVKAVEYEGQEMNVYFNNYYGQPVEVQYVAPGKKSKEGQFAVADARPESSFGYDSAPDFEQIYVKDIDEVLGGSGEVEKYATKAKTRRSTKGAEEFEDNEIRALMEIDRLKDEGIIEWLKN